MAQTDPNPNFLNRLLNKADQVIGDEGFKTDVRVELGNDLYYKLFATIVAAGIALAVIVMTVQTLKK
ncbi:hypothetical protein SAMN05421823_11969 [Catalinimonas alkaloidigena]|uniref:Uncharacterized protein n=1 Tax=Catalinimonas alkaloidigena TaxID=1075417 RepID=A0A1G9VBA9_9BACT|nr:hypothetical protein [Catalinimonas alkaloidigena]SDM69155.1 hypothetical protein SAMN05421823_11969 [Catalinimonas alkaloidigena]